MVPVRTVCKLGWNVKATVFWRFSVVSTGFDFLGSSSVTFWQTQRSHFFFPQQLPVPPVSSDGAGFSSTQREGRFQKHMVPSLPWRRAKDSSSRTSLQGEGQQVPALHPLVPLLAVLVCHAMLIWFAPWFS